MSVDSLAVCRIPLILASASPRRHALLRQAGCSFTTVPVDADESCPPHLTGAEIPLYLAKRKAEAFFETGSLPTGTVLVTADTIVWLEGRVLGKPAGRDAAIAMLEALSGKMHQVFTGVCLRSATRQSLFHVESRVYFRRLAASEIAYYVDRFRPYDKAGAYGIQEWIGCVGIEKIEGSYHNVVGLPVEQLFCRLNDFVNADEQ